MISIKVGGFNCTMQIINKPKDAESCESVNNVDECFDGSEYVDLEDRRHGEYLPKNKGKGEGGGKAVKAPPITSSGNL